MKSRARRHEIRTNRKNFVQVDQMWIFLWFCRKMEWKTEFSAFLLCEKNPIFLSSKLFFWVGCKKPVKNEKVIVDYERFTKENISRSHNYRSNASKV